MCSHEEYLFSCNLDAICIPLCVHVCAEGNITDHKSLSNLKVLKVGEKNTGIELSEDSVKINVS